MGKKAPNERRVPADLGSSIDSNLGAGKDEDKGTHVLRTKKHPFHDFIEAGNGMTHKVDSHLFKAYDDTIKSRIAKYKPGDNINRPIAGPARIFQQYPGSELESHFRGPDMDKKHANPDYNKTVYYGTDKNRGFSGVYKTEERIPKSETSPLPTKNKLGVLKRNTDRNGPGLFNH